MAKIIIMQGLPASGKSTKAEKLLKQGNTVRLNKDLLRTMLHFDRWSGINEGLTRDASRELAKMYLAKNINVIIDDTNLNPNTVQSWVALAKEVDAKIEYQDTLDVSVEECIRRDFARAGKGGYVGPDVIKKMAIQYLGYLKGENVVVCDLDGTLADISHRLHFVESEPKDWKSFFAGINNDTSRDDVWKQVKSTGGKVILVSARPEDYRAQTEGWLFFNGIRYDVLIMRPKGDRRPDTEVKSEIYEKYLKDMNIIKVFDDRPSVIRMWREKGLEVEDVGQGIEF